MPRHPAVSEQSVIALAKSAMRTGQQALVAGDGRAGRIWLDRAHRLVPGDSNATLLLASICLTDDPARAARLFMEIAERMDVGAAWGGLATACLRLDDLAGAAHAVAHLLSRHTLTAEARALAAAVDRQAGHPGWCGLLSDGTLVLQAHAQPVRILIDGRLVRTGRLPTEWPSARAVAVQIGDTHLLGSPIRIDAIQAVAGCIEPRDGEIAGWAWHPADPDRHPELTLHDAAGDCIRHFVADDTGISVPDTGGLARPRGIRVPAAWLANRTGPFHIRGPSGKDLTGSPIDPRADQQAHIATALRISQSYPVRQHIDNPPCAAAALRADVPRPPMPIGAGARRRSAAVVIPVHDGFAVASDCLDSVLDTVPSGTSVIVVDDGSRDPQVVTWLDELAGRNAVTLIRHVAARGFPAAANAGMLAARGRDVVLLNSDTLVPPKWLERLHEAAYGSRDVGTVTPLSNDGSICTYPGQVGANQAPDQAPLDQAPLDQAPLDQAQIDRIDRLLRKANGTAVADIPVGVGFCLYIRRDCLNTVGLFRADLFAQGYGEESDFCLRAQRLGWRNVALAGLYVGHVGGQSFGPAAIHLRARNTRMIESLHPGYQALVNRHMRDDTLLPFRRRADIVQLRQRARAWASTIILITHNDGGGVEQRLAMSIQAHAAAGRWPVVLRPVDSPDGTPGIAVQDSNQNDLPNLTFRMPDEAALLLRLLRSLQPDGLEVHHLLGHHPAVYSLLTDLNVPYAVHIHDYAWICPRVVLVTGPGRYCGEPDVTECAACVADHGHFLQEDISVLDLRARSARFLSGAQAVFVPSDDVGRRIRRHIPGLRPQTIPHSDDTRYPRLSIHHPRKQGEPIRICIVGGIAPHKGYDLLLACARDAARRSLDLQFIIVGHTIDDARMLDTGRVFITGRFHPAEVAELIGHHAPQLGFVPSICPETWCLSLGDLWQAGLRVAAFDIGAPAERIRRSGRGFLLPLGLSVSAINNSLVAAADAAAP